MFSLRCHVNDQRRYPADVEMQAKIQDVNAK